MELRNGMMVKHETLGLGKVVALDELAVHVVFAGDARLATKLRLPLALDFLTPTRDANAWLAGLSGFVLDEKTGRYGRTTTWLSHPEAVERFTQTFPKGFAAPGDAPPEAGRSDRIARWRKAGVEYAALLGDGKGERLLRDGDIAGLIERIRKVEKLVRSLHREEERVSLEARLEDPEKAATWFEALFAFIGAARPHRGRFEALAAATAALDPDAPIETGWPVVTLLPFIARPELHMLLRPRFACDVAQRLGLDLTYDAEPNWATYSSLLASSAELLERLAPLGARDHVDIEVFMQVAMAKVARPRPARDAPARAVAAKAAPKATPKRKTARAS